MNSQPTTSVCDRVARTAGLGLCPQCQTPMKETYRTKENNFIYVWHDCPQPSCGGQWLEKIGPATLRRFGINE